MGEVVHYPVHLVVAFRHDESNAVAAVAALDAEDTRIWETACGCREQAGHQTGGYAYSGTEACRSVAGWPRWYWTMEEH